MRIAGYCQTTHVTELARTCYLHLLRYVWRNYLGNKLLQYGGGVPFLYILLLRIITVCKLRELNNNITVHVKQYTTILQVHGSLSRVWNLSLPGLGMSTGKALNVKYIP